MRAWISLVFSCLLFLPAWAADPTQATAPASELRVLDPWVREAPPTVPTLAAFMTLDNPGVEPRVIQRAECADFESVELHATIMEGELARMVEQKQLEIPAQGQLELKPRSYHIMLMKAKRVLKAGDEVKILLHFANGEQREVTAPVRKMTGMPMHHHPKEMKHGS